MSSLIRRMRKGRRDHFGRRMGKWLCQHNAKAPKPNSSAAKGSRRGVVKRSFRAVELKVRAIKAAPYVTPNRADRQERHRRKMAMKAARRATLKAGWARRR